MAIHYRTQGFVLKKRDFREADRIFTVFTKDFGKLEILGRGIRKIKSKLRGGMKLFSLADIEFIQGKTHKTLTDANSIEIFQNIKRDLKRLKIAFDISDVLDSLVKEPEKEQKIWDLLKFSFQTLNRFSLSVKECWLIFYNFLWKILVILGYKPELNYCCICQKKPDPKNLYFNLKEGGIICSDCFQKKKEGKKIQPGTVKILRFLAEKDLSFLRKLKITLNYKREIKKISQEYFSFIKKNLI